MRRRPLEPLLGHGGRVSKRRSPGAWPGCANKIVLRLFLAIPLPEGPRRRLAEVQCQLRSQADNVRWCAAENFHLTLQFLGETDPVLLPQIQVRMTKAALTVSPFELALAGLGKFSGGAVWAGLRAAPELARLVDALGAPPIHPHITLGRARGRVRLKLDAVASMGRFRVGEIALMSSQLGPNGAVYTPEFSAPLGEEEESRSAPKAPR